MCGIAGFWSATGLESHRLSQRISTLVHRGPDDQQSKLFFREKKAIAGLATQRLSIVGVNDGQQPVRDPSGRWWVSMNGEIYNHPTLRRECLGNNTTPLNDSDTAVVAAMLSFLPISKVIERLRGMFALAIYDSYHHEIWLYRDRMGVKPLYWTRTTDGSLHWASELRALKGLHSHKINSLAVQHLLCFEYIPAPLSIFEEVTKLLPATFLHASSKNFIQEHYWSFPTQNPNAGGAMVQWEKSLQMALDSATNLRLQADVEVGTLLSGGIDSATITAIAAQKHPNIHSFSVAINETGFNEEEAIKDTLNSLPIQHHIFSFNQTQFHDTYSAMIEHIDEPLADSSLLVTWFLFEQIQKYNIKCVLSGDGADEIFAGYPTYLAHKYLPHPLPFREIAKRLIRRLPINQQGVSWEYMAKRLLYTSEDLWQRRHQLWMGAWRPEELDCSQDIWQIADNWSTQAGTDRVGRAMFLDQRLYLAEGVLVKTDRASMAHGIEVRSPFLDHLLVELLADIPISMKVSASGNKKILRRLLPSMLSSQTQHRKKKGFGSPVGPWLRQDCQYLLDGLPDALEKWIPKQHLNTIIREHLQGRQDHRRRLWSAIILAGWLQKHSHR